MFMQSDEREKLVRFFVTVRLGLLNLIPRTDWMEGLNYEVHRYVVLPSYY